MKMILILFFFSSVVNAAEINLEWKHTARDLNNYPIRIHKWKLYFGVEGASVSNLVIFDTPQPLPVGTDTTNLYYKHKLSNTKWVVGQNVCFEMVATTWIGAVEVDSAKSNRVCKIIGGRRPNQPTDVKIDWED